jgi:hypothetical protein
MKRVAFVVVLVGAACGGNKGPGKANDASVDDVDARVIDAPLVDAPADSKLVDAPMMVDAKLDASPIIDAPPDAASSVPCNPLTQAGCAAGEKCTWLLDQVTPTYIGHIGCAPNGTAMAGDACMYGAPGVTGYDGCQRGLVCGDYRGGTGVCKTICDNQGGNPQCATNDVCVVYSGLFYTGGLAAAGVCDPRCDPLADNDFDGSGAMTKTGTTCGSAANRGCYGYPSFGTPPATGFSCTTDINVAEGQPLGLRHRVQCLETNSCADPGPTIYVNSCNQGYLPLLRESTTVSTAVCVAMCRPMNCYSGNCGTANANRAGAAPHRCNTTDRLGTFDTSANGEHCRYIWSFEIDDQGNFLRSPSSDTVGFCFDHSKYLYDSDGNNTPDMQLPECAALQPGFGSGSNPADPLTYFGAADLGCVDTATGGVMFAGKPRVPRETNGVRPLYAPTPAP